MPAQSRRSQNRPSRAQRRAGIQTTRTYTVPDAPTAAPVAAAAAPRRVYIAEPTPVDHAAEFRAISKDLRRILIWAALIVVVMIVLSFVL